MSRRAWRLGPALVAAAIVVGLAPAGALAHAYLIRTVPGASGVLDGPPRSVQLTYDEAVEPRLAIISVTDAAGRPQTSGAVSRSPVNPDTLAVPLRAGLAQGWYLVYWRAISLDGHPVQGAFTYAVGPNPGPAPRFAVPNIGASAKSPDLLVTRWLMLAGVMSAIGLFVFRLLIARPLARDRPEAALRSVSRAFAATAALGLLSTVLYLDFATANASLRSVSDVGALWPLLRVTAFGRAYVDMTVCFALFCLSAWIAVLVDRPQRPRRSVAELAATSGALLAAAGVLVIPGTAGHAAHTPPRGISVALDWLHLVTGSVWLGGLIGLLVLWFGLRAGGRVRGLAVVVPRFSAVALVSVLILLGTGTWATINHMPTLSALWLTGYGVAILVKIGLLLAAVGLATVNLLRTRPRLAAAAARPELGEGTARLLRRVVSSEAVLVVGAVFAAAVLSSLGPPPPAFALQDSALARVGPGRVAATVSRSGYVLQVLVSPNRAAAPDSFALRITRHGQPVRGASVTLAFDHTEMEMPQQEYQLREREPGLYRRAAAALVMVGPWALTFQIAPPGGRPFTALILDQANG